MSDIFDFDEFKQNMADAADSLSRLNSGLGSATRSTSLYDSASRDAQRAIRDEIRVRKEGIENIKKELLGFRDSVVGTGKAMASGGSNFTTLNSVVSTTITTMGSFASGLARLIPIFGEGIGSIIDAGSKAVAEGSQIAIQQFEIGFTAFKQAAKVGAIDTFTDLRVTSAKLNLRMEDLANVLVTNSDKLTQIGGSAISGKTAFQQLAEGSDQLRREFLRLGTDTQEFSNLQIGMLNQFARTGKSLKDVDRIQSDYMNNLQLISELTGKNKETLQKERDERLNEFKFRSQFEKLSKREQMDLQAKLDFAKKVNPEYEKALKGYIGTGGLIIGKQLQTSFLRSGGAERDVAMRMGNMSMQDFIRESIGVGKRVKGRVDPYARVLDESSSMVGAGITGYYDLANMKEEDIKKLQDAIARNRENRDTETAQLADTASALQRSSVNLQQLAVSVDTVRNAMKAFGKVIEKFTGKLNEYFGGVDSDAESPATGAGPSSPEESSPATPPGDIPAASPARPVPKTRSLSGAGGGGMTPTSAGVDMNPGMMTAGGGPIAFDASDNKPVGYDPRDPNNTVWGPIKFGDRGPDSKMSRYAVLDPRIQERFKRAAVDFYKLTGKPVTFSSGLRTREEQARLYQRYMRGGPIAARPGESNHEFGLGLDVTGPHADLLDSSGILKKHGLHRPVPGDKYHIEVIGISGAPDKKRKRVTEAALGGIVEATQGGRPLLAAEAGMNEAFVPLPDGKTIPVTMSESGVFGDIKMLLSDIKSVLESGNGIHKKQFMLARN